MDDYSMAKPAVVLRRETMSRFLLDDSTLSSISQDLPDLYSLQKTVLRLTPDILSMKFAPESAVPVAAICLQDATNTLFEARYALQECFAHRIWYGEQSEPPNKFWAVFFGRFYADDTALRLYSAGEHLANAILFMLEISDQQLKKYKRPKRSQQSVIGHFLAKEEPHHPITRAVLKLSQSKEWQDTNKYRNYWVHEQPPTVEGLGTVYRRDEQRWQVAETEAGMAKRKISSMVIGGGDEPEYSIADLLNFIKPALFLLTDTLTTVVQFYLELLKKRGITVDEHGPQVRL
jgi:hypothetical protein